MPPRLLFIPVSGAFGMGEYARSLSLARAFQAHRPEAEIHFVISAQAPYARTMPFAHTALPSSPTFHTPEVSALIARMRPDVVIFDNAGRSAQLAAARAASARIIYISARKRQRRKAFRGRWMRMIDEHWIAYPEFIAGSLSMLERIKLHLHRRPRIRYLDCLLPALPPEQEAALFARVNARPGEYLLVVPGGGTGHPGALDAVAAFRDTAVRLAGHGHRTLAVMPGGMSGASVDDPPLLTRADLLPLPELIALIRGAKAMLGNGGGTLIQAIACRTPTVSVPIAKDQARRIRTCVRSGLTLSCDLHPDAMSTAVLGLLSKLEALDRMRTAMRKAALRDSLQTTVAAIDGLLPR